MHELALHQRPWYLTGAELGFKRCSCGAVIVVLEPALPDLPWPHTDGGTGVLALARQKAGSLLRPYLDALLADPRQRLPLAPKHENPGEGASGATDNPGDAE